MYFQNNGYDEAEIVYQCLNGNAATWEYLIHKYSRRVYNLAYRFFARHELAEDLTQEVFIRIYKSLDQYDPRLGDLDNWLLRLTRNLIIDHYRRCQTRQASEDTDDIDDYSNSLHDKENTPHQFIERKELNLQVIKAIDKLPHQLRQCIQMRDIEELSYQDIGTSLNIPEGTVKSRISRARLELAKMLHHIKI